ncbi:type III-B CRISPR module RAMP protein Cmr4 [Scytonema sp. UIC 10036]|uniref:type III-B CRISPR module RAMP protein Cmr4 n=1 Tax=Scytonema sp. UIC 10036 TaxID=2304196 RepID=UPI0013841611|nr:type III-B CRISPR module RAMP protein Cmr4 [Scytonema sp. UIC 10036]
MKTNLSYIYLLSPLHTGGASQEGNTVGIAREAHTDLPYMSGGGIRGRIRASTPKERQKILWGNTIEDVQQHGDNNLTQGALWIGDAAILWFPIPSLSHGIVWITSPFLLRRWLRLHDPTLPLPQANSFSGGNRNQLYLKDAIFQAIELHEWSNWKDYIPKGNAVSETIDKALILSNTDCKVLIQTSLWQQVRVNLGEGKVLAENAGFRYEEAIPPETLMYFPWGSTTTANGNGHTACTELKQVFDNQNIWQFGGQESLGRGLVELWTPELLLSRTKIT